MSYDDWTQSDRDTGRVWLYDKQSALGQFAFITPIHRVRHWNPAINKRVKWLRKVNVATVRKVFLR